MNGELPPIDPEIREHLARRSAGRLPDGLLAEVSAAVDAVSVERPRRLRPGPAAIGAPRLAAAASLALVVVVAAALVVAPRFMTSPAGKSGFAALTSSELAALLANTPPAVNAAIVATVTVDSRNDVCPMNRYPTLGVIEGMGSQVCVMGADVTAYLSSDRANAARVSGTFAFRYLAPGYLGLLGQLTLPATGLTFGATDEWPLQGRTFLVEGWLGADGLLESCVTTPTSGDVLLPDGGDCPFDNWLGMESTAAGIAGDHEFAPGSSAPTYDPLSLRGNARHVEAGGMRIIDSIDHAAPVHGVYVVRSVTEGCPNASPIDSRGCGVWRVLARVPETSLHAPTASETPTPTPASSGPPLATPVATPLSYPESGPLTAAALGRLMAAGIYTDQVLVAEVSFAPGPGCEAVKGYAPIGALAGISPKVCVVGIADGMAVHSPAATSGVFAFRVLDQHTLGFMATIDAAGANRLTYRGNDSWPAGKTILVSGWLAAGTGVFSCAMMGAVVSEPLDPGGVPCGAYYILDQQMPSPLLSASSGPAGFERVALPDYPDVGGGLLPHDLRATYLVRDEARCNSVATSTDSAVNTTWDKLCGWQIMARVDSLTMPASMSTVGPPATLAPPATPLIPPGGSPIGLFGEGNRPLTAGEFASLWASDPAHLAGRIVVAKGPVPTGFQCWDAGAADNAVPSPACHVASIDDKSIAMDGYWVIRVGADGKLSILGEISTPDGSFVYSFDEAKASGIYSGKPVMVDAWLNANGDQSHLMASDTWSSDGIVVSARSFVILGDNVPRPGHGIYLIQYVGGSVEVLARLEVAVP